MKKSDGLTTCLGLIMGFLVAVVVNSLLTGWALSTIWNWYIPPLFHLTTLTFAQAIGVAMVFHLFTGEKSSNESSKSDTFGEAMVMVIVKAIVSNGFTVAFAWVILQFAF